MPISDTQTLVKIRVYAVVILYSQLHESSNTSLGIKVNIQFADSRFMYPVMSCLTPVHTISTREMLDFVGSKS
jgi:hypothetical protein